MHTNTYTYTPTHICIYILTHTYVYHIVNQDSLPNRGGMQTTLLTSTRQGQGHDGARHRLHRGTGVMCR